MYGEDLTDAQILFDKIQVNEIEFNNTQSVLVVLNYGNLTILNSKLSNISSSLFQFTRSHIKFDQITINQIKCETASSACLISGKHLDLQILNSTIKEIESTKQLIDIVDSTNIILESLNLFKISQIRDSQDSYAIQVTKANNLEIKNSHFSELDFSVFKAKTSNVCIMQTTFSNQESKRIIMSSENERKAIQFMSLEESNSRMLQNTFIQGEQNNGGVNKNLVILFISKLGNTNSWNWRKSSNFRMHFPR